MVPVFPRGWWSKTVYETKPENRKKSKSDNAWKQDKIIDSESSVNVREWRSHNSNYR